MAINKIYRFSKNAAPSDTLTDADYSTDAERPIGHQVGVARNELANKLGEQTSAVSASWAQVVADNQLNDVTDAATTTALAGYMVAAINKLVSLFFGGATGPGTGKGLDADTLDGIHSTGFDAAGAATTAVSDHVALADPHSQYAEIVGQVFTGDISAPGITAEGSFTSPGIDDNATSNAVTIDTSQNVSVGTTVSRTKLYASGSDPSGNFIGINSELDDYETGIKGYSNDEEQWKITKPTYNSGLNFVDNKEFGFKLDDGTELFYIWGSGIVTPGSDNTQQLGDPSLRWSTVYAGTGAFTGALSAGDISAERIRGIKI